MDAKSFNGTTKYQKFLLSPKITYLDYIKLHYVHGNPLGTVAGFLQAGARSTLACHTYFHGYFLPSTNSRITSCQLLAKQKGR